MCLLYNSPREKDWDFTSSNLNISIPWIFCAATRLKLLQSDGSVCLQIRFFSCSLSWVGGWGGTRRLEAVIGARRVIRPKNGSWGKASPPSSIFRLILRWEEGGEEAQLQQWGWRRVANWRPRRSWHRTHLRDRCCRCLRPLFQLFLLWLL